MGAGIHRGPAIARRECCGNQDTSVPSLPACRPRGVRDGDAGFHPDRRGTRRCRPIRSSTNSTRPAVDDAPGGPQPRRAMPRLRPSTARRPTTHRWRPILSARTGRTSESVRLLARGAVAPARSRRPSPIRAAATGCGAGRRSIGGSRRPSRATSGRPGAGRHRDQRGPRVPPPPSLPAVGAESCVAGVGGVVGGRGREPAASSSGTSNRWSLRRSGVPTAAWAADPPSSSSIRPAHVQSGRGPRQHRSHHDRAALSV